jgi:hypothetical protein
MKILEYLKCFCFALRLLFQEHTRYPIIERHYLALALTEYQTIFPFTITLEIMS